MYPAWPWEGKQLAIPSEANCKSLGNGWYALFSGSCQTNSKKVYHLKIFSHFSLNTLCFLQLVCLWLMLIALYASCYMMLFETSLVLNEKLDETTVIAYIEQVVLGKWVILSCASCFFFNCTILIFYIRGMIYLTRLIGLILLLSELLRDCTHALCIFVCLGR